MKIQIYKTYQNLTIGYKYVEPPYWAITRDKFQTIITVRCKVSQFSSRKILENYKKIISLKLRFLKVGEHYYEWLYLRTLVF